MKTNAEQEEQRRLLWSELLSMMPDGWRQRLEIPYYVMNFKKEFKENVMDYFVDRNILDGRHAESLYCL